MSGPAKRTARPLSVRFTESERQRLRKLAGPKSISLFVRERALDGMDTPRRSSVKDADALGRLLGILGQSRLANNLNQLAKAANLGSLPVTAELETELSQARADIREMRMLLLRALGIQLLEVAQDQPPPITGQFADAALRIPE